MDLFNIPDPLPVLRSSPVLDQPFPPHGHQTSRALMTLMKITEAARIALGSPGTITTPNWKRIVL